MYAEPGVADSCLSFQDRHAADVNVILFCLWFAESGRGRLRRPEFSELLDEVAIWRDQVILPLRALRDRLKEDVSGVPKAYVEVVRSTVKRGELDAEHAAQLVLADRAPAARNESVHPEAAAMDAAENLAQYLSLLKVTTTAQEQAWAAKLLSAAFPAVSDDKISVLCRFES